MATTRSGFRSIPAQAPGAHRFAAYRTADPGYFSTMEIPLIPRAILF